MASSTLRELHGPFSRLQRPLVSYFCSHCEYVSKFFTAVPWVVFACTLGSLSLVGRCAPGAARFMVSKQMLYRLQLQTQLLGSMQQYSRAVLEAIPDGLLMLDIHGHMTGYQLDDLHGRSPSSCPPTPSQPGATVSSNSGSRSSRLRRRRNRTLDPTSAAPSNSSCLTASPTASASTTSIQIDHGAPPFSPPSTHTRSSRFWNRRPRGANARKDGSTFIAQLRAHGRPAVPPRPDPTLSTHPRTNSSPDPAVSSHDHGLLASDVDTYLARADSPSSATLNPPTFHQIVLFHDITPRVEAMHQHLLRFLIQAMTVPVQHMMHDLDVIARAAETRTCSSSQGTAGTAERDADLADAKAAAKHIANVLDDVAVYAGVQCLDQQQQPASSPVVDACGLEAGQTPCGKCPGCGPQGKLVRELGIVLTVSVGRASGDLRVPPGFACVVCKLLHKFVALATMVARPAALMTLAVIDEPTTMATVTSSQEDPVMHFLVTLSAFDSQFPSTTVSHDLNLAVGSRGSTFGNVALTWAAVIQLVERNGGHIQQSRVSPGTGLVVSVKLPVPSSRVCCDA
ncbi:hypothetical protein BCR44DRAFT_1424003 [Catenaria anguillulae PL171]|uniref:Uncharacterized protein n=1 Tax=Catenaria anguillulae PL171 TaxID=765915 RepID=A0A1Y2I4I8_9FUNG|nr:hypothetical protein BCR44DRAFT_1424003 [Catenaria anguillulae PL171]